MKSKEEIQDKLSQVLAMDARVDVPGMTPGAMMFVKSAAAKTLLWVLGVNDDDSFYIKAAPGPAIKVRRM